jgi:hypothetical protein
MAHGKYHAWIPDKTTTERAEELPDNYGLNGRTARRLTETDKLGMISYGLNPDSVDQEFPDRPYMSGVWEAIDESNSAIAFSGLGIREGSTSRDSTGFTSWIDLVNPFILKRDSDRGEHLVIYPFNKDFSQTTQRFAHNLGRRQVRTGNDNKDFYLFSGEDYFQIEELHWGDGRLGVLVPENLPVDEVHRRELAQIASMFNLTGEEPQEENYEHFAYLNQDFQAENGTRFKVRTHQRSPSDGKATINPSEIIVIVNPDDEHLNARMKQNLGTLCRTDFPGEFTASNEFSQPKIVKKTIETLLYQ